MIEDIIERLNAQIKEIRSAWAFETTALREENARYKLTYAKYVEVIDRMNGTPCEQIRHQQEVEALREEIARLEERNKKLNDDLLKQAELTAVTMTRCADLMPAQSAIVKLKDQQAEIDALKAEVAKLRKLLFDFEKFQEIYEKAMETK